jgi:serine/threonine protein kinase
MRQIASGVDFIHQHGQVHRDLKPANGTHPFSLINFTVLYSHKDAQWKLGDFGLTCEGTLIRDFTTTFARGTAGYRAPELLTVTTKLVYNNKADIWSMGCILYELATHKQAFLNDFAVYHCRLTKSNIRVPLADRFDKDTKGLITTYSLLPCLNAG